MLLYTGQTVQNVSEDQFVFLVRLKLSELLEIKKKKKRWKCWCLAMLGVNFFGFFTSTDFSRLLP